MQGWVEGAQLGYYESRRLRKKCQGVCSSSAQKHATWRLAQKMGGSEVVKVSASGNFLLSLVLPLGEGLCSFSEPPTLLPASPHPLWPPPICSRTQPRDPDLDLSWLCQLPYVGATELRTFPRDVSEAISQMHHLHYICKTHLCPLVWSSCQGNIKDDKLLRVQTLEDELASVTCYTANKYMKSTGLCGHWKRTALCASWGQVRFSELMSQTSLIQVALNSVSWGQGC